MHVSSSSASTQAGYDSTYQNFCGRVLAELAIFVIAETMTVEETVGGPIQMAVITQAAGFQRVHQQDIICMLQSHQKRFARFNQICRNIAFRH